MNRTELRFALRTLPFLDSRAQLPAGALELRPHPGRRLLVWHPDAIEAVFRADQRLGHPGSRSFRPLMGPKSLLWQEGERHASYRRVLGTPLRGRRLAGYREMIAATVHEAIDALPTGAEPPIADWTRRIALRIMARIVFGEADEGVLEPFAAWMDRALGSRYRTLAYRYVKGNLPLPGATLEHALTAAARTAARANPATLAGQLLGADSPFAGIDDGELRDQIVSLLFAGHETTASTAAWALFWLSRDDSLRERVVAEVSSSDGFAADEVPVLQAVVQETLRITPPVPAAGNRVLTRDCPFDGGTVAAGTVVTPSIYLAHHRADSFAEPYRFDAGRFLGGRVPPQRYFPFGGGIRHCLGSQLGQAEVRMIVAAMLRRRELVCVDPRAGVPQLRGHAMAPSPRLRIRILKCRD
ncbi:cytochrome P450 [Amycolatopsis sp. K13G38]|uniref:Cytochrome P450 n=1 Tax=Amycolatopsis acididurans TaxID=2724524 RepID=A0ABX1J352_9PSEU|nr:cytochrome P450 [Amycolatopsis acididurans]NKQ52760.1 cytochrome P450 [Amycolatopsis acididurans]